MELKLIENLRAINKGVALMVGFGLLLCAAFVLIDIVSRQIGTSFGGTEEIAGYTMALATSWGMSFTLLELGHVRIDLLRSRAGSFKRALFDVFAMIVMSGVVITIAIKAWPVLERSITNGSRANTPLETPLVWVQAPWFAGWVWFALMSSLTTIAALSLLLKKRHAETEKFVGAFAEQETLQ
ncbi:TRAP transporter small permease subunit [Yoonia sediminilitoris]|uniref:TRAP transporter small permease protein n=1 Tax=Yoonia sediminilitoris TaxID=1286148 RepID=A0A2T6KEM4_9RHOB|nr:TRAP transporter small permease [Yoonia sediminilitoris]PUB13568.1 TRAP-type mannitol/chloroaromatic compound transport system permease small subunit [Yoonia sediminilitoris]RCW94738.1 TRAP-type mannitol/chloroaromatic compound transport system permease small subunit [Yoonia sediminilitoris]